MKKLAIICLVASLFPGFQTVYADASHHHQSMETMAHHTTLPTLNTQVTPVANTPDLWQIKIIQTKNGRPVRLKDLQEAHTSKIHLLIIDDTLEDYTHVHPQASKQPGVYEFQWKPKSQGNYYIWADLIPVATQQEEYVVTQVFLGPQPAAKPVMNQTAMMENRVDHYKFTLTFKSGSLIAGQNNMGELFITDSQGNPVKNLEPIMGAYAHIVGFSGDMKSIIHIHPMGQEPQKATDRGGPLLKFHINPEKPGFIKIFAQVKIAGKEIYIPFRVIAQEK